MPTINDFPKALQIYDADVNITINLQKHGKLCRTTDSSEIELEKLITVNVILDF